MSSTILSFRYSASPSGVVSKTAPNNLVSGQWAMVTVVVTQVDASNMSVRLFVDGTELGSATDGANTMDRSGNTKNFHIGNTDSTQIYFEGDIDNLCIFNKALSYEEVQLLYNDGNGTEELIFNNNAVIFNDEIRGFTGNGYMAYIGEGESSSYLSSDSGIINYPIRNSVPGSYNVWIRCHTGGSDPSGSSVFDMDMLLDEIVVKNINSTIANDGWVWLNTTLILPDTQQHILGIRLKEKGSAIDKIYINADTDFIPEGDGPPYATSPYATIHMKVYESDGASPTNQLNVYDYKTTLDEVIQDDWYNFNISLTDRIIDEYGESLFLVMSSSGANADNFITWEVTDSDEYLSGNVGLRLTEIASDSSLINTSLTKRLYYKSKAGDVDIDTDTWYLDNTKTHAFKIFSDFDPIEDV
jgi:hypothetical protein